MLIKTMLAFRPKRNDMIFAVKTFMAAMLALYIAISLDLINPMWSMATVFIVANPLAGVLASKATFRLMGTFCGACVAIAILPALMNSLLLFSLVLSFWVGFCLFVSLLDRTPRSYFFMLMGYTTSLIGFSAVNAPTNLFYIALSRFEEISIGIVCATVVSRTIYPMTIGPVLSGRISKWMDDIELSFRNCLLGESNSSTIIQGIQRFAGDVTELHGLAIHLSYESSLLSGKTREIQALQHQMVLLLPALVGLSNRLSKLFESNDAFKTPFATLYADTMLYLQQEIDTSKIQCTQPEPLLQQFEPMMAMATVEEQLLLMNIREAFRFYVQHMQIIRQLWLNIQSKSKSLLPNKQQTHKNLHLDHGVALRAAISAVLAINVGSFLWYWSAWQYGSLMPMIASILACILTFMDDPVPGLLGFVKASIVATFVVFFYQFGVFPMLHSFWAMMLVIFPFFFIFCTMLTSPALMLFSLPMLILTAMQLNIKNINTPDFNGFIDGTLASIFGVLIPALTIALLRSMSPQQSIQRLLQAQWQEIRQIIARQNHQPWTYYLRRMLDRIGLMSPRALRAPGAQTHIAQSIIELSGTINILRLKHCQSSVDATTRQSIQRILDALYVRYGQYLQQQPVQDDDLIQQVDQLMNELLIQPASAMRDQLLVSLTGMRQALFQQAVSYHAPMSVADIPALGGTYGWRA